MDANLTKIIEQRANQACNDIVWGRDECATWAADTLKDMTGYDLMASWRGTYSSEVEAQEQLQRRGGGLVKQVMIAVRDAGWTRIDPDQVNGPALALFKTINEGVIVHAVAVWCAPGWFMARGVQGVTIMPSNFIVRAWQCPQP